MKNTASCLEIFTIAEITFLTSVWVAREFDFEGSKRAVKQNSLQLQDPMFVLDEWTCARCDNMVVQCVDDFVFAH